MCSYKDYGTNVVKEENPRSRVIPLYFDWGLLSRLAVDAIWVRDLQIEVLPESTWPRTPTFMFKHWAGLIVWSIYKEMSKS